MYGRQGRHGYNTTVPCYMNVFKVFEKFSQKFWEYQADLDSCTMFTIFCILSYSVAGSIGNGLGSFFDLAGRFRKFGDSFKLKNFTCF